MLIKEMKEGKTLDILVDRDGYHYHFVSKIEGVTSNAVAVSLIATARRTFRFEERDDITIIYRGAERMWKWEHVKGGMAMLEGTPVHTFFSRAEGVSYNRRESFRVPIGESLLMRRIVKEKDENDEIQEREVNFEALLSDLSVTGAGLYTNEALDIGTTIVFDMPTNLGLLSCRGDIIREAEVFDRPFRHFYGCDFTVVKKGLEKYLFERQRLMLQRERGGESMQPKLK
ncbi:MAG: PilZ domain-containing protein [Lachnospiraceae bacterium]